MQEALSSSWCSDPCVNGGLDSTSSFCRLLTACSALHALADLNLTNEAVAVPHHLTVVEELINANDCSPAEAVQKPCLFGCAASAEISWARMHAERAAALMGARRSSRTTRHRALLSALEDRAQLLRSLAARTAFAGDNGEEEHSDWPFDHELRKFKTVSHANVHDGRTAVIALYRPKEDALVTQTNAELKQSIGDALNRAYRSSLGPNQSDWGSVDHLHAFFAWQMDEADSRPLAECENGTASVRELRGSPAFQWLHRQLTHAFADFNMRTSATRIAVRGLLAPCSSAGPQVPHRQVVWANVMGDGDGGGAFWHNHAEAQRSAVYFVEAPPGAGALEFALGPPAQHATVWSLEPRAGDLIVYSSWLWHNAATSNFSHNRGARRISVAADQSGYWFT